MSDEKTEEPTQSKLRKSREDGQVAKSQDLAVAGSLLGVMIALSVMADGAAERLRNILRLALDFGNGDLPGFELYQRIGSMALQAMLIAAPLALVAALGAAIGLLSHIGLVIAMKAVAPKLESLDPVAGMKKIFSLKSLLTFLQMVFKAVVLGATLWQVITGLLPLIGASTYQSLGGIATLGWTAIVKVLCIALGLFLVLGPVDYGIQRWLFMKGQRMSKDDIKREYKGQEGDPQMKGQRKQIAHELAQASPRKAVAGANAVIVNPTHYAVAVRYHPGEAGLPVVVARGVDAEALRIRRFAQEQGVPVFANPPLARALHKVEPGGSVPEELFEAVAAVLRWVDEVGRNPSDRR
jgi:type III secretion protein U